METVDEATERLAGFLQDGDVVLLKGSLAMRMELLIEPIRQAAAKRPAAAKAANTESSNP